MVRFKILAAASLALVAGAAIACGGSSKSSSSGASPSSTSSSSSSSSTSAATSPTTTATKAAPTAAAPQLINVNDVEDGDKYAFNPNQLQAKPGQVTIHYTNPSTSARNHTFELKGADGSDIVKSDQVAPGQTVDFTFTVTSPGTYNFLCYNRGHADRGQTGTLTVSGPTG